MVANEDLPRAGGAPKTGVIVVVVVKGLVEVVVGPDWIPPKSGVEGDILAKAEKDEAEATGEEETSQAQPRPRQALLPPLPQ